KMPVPQKLNILVEWASSPNARCLFHKNSIFLWNGLLARTGKMPVPQKLNILVEWASSPFLRMV
ncbi:MAG: hypothetical protein WCD53_25585, partial [Microcoleus sp.]